MFDIDKVRSDFPYLDESKTEGRKIIYLDNAATTQKPQIVINSITNYYSYQNANPHRGAHYLSNIATMLYENTRKKVKTFIGAKKTSEIIFTKNATEGLNLLAYSYGLNNLKKDDEVLISILEHHSNLCSWQMVCKKTGAKLKYIYVDKNLQLENFEDKITDKTKIISITAASNVTGTHPNIEKIIELGHKKGAKVFVDASQLIGHKKINVMDLDVDALVFSGHKMYSAMGVGVVYGKYEILNEMEPFLYGGDMIEYVYEDHSIFLKPSQRFEAGTPATADIISLSSAIDFIEDIGIENIGDHEKKLIDLGYDLIKELDFIDIFTTPSKDRAPVLTFNIKGAHPHDVSSILDSFNIAVRAGHHCCEPLHRFLKQNSTVRASFGVYNTEQEVRYFIEKLYEVRRILRLGH